MVAFGVLGFRKFWNPCGIWYRVHFIARNTAESFNMVLTQPNSEAGPSDCPPANVQLPEPEKTITSHCRSAGRRSSDGYERLQGFAYGLIGLVSPRCVRFTLLAGIGLLLTGQEAVGFVPMTPTMRLEKTDQTKTPAIGDTSGKSGGDGPVVIRSSDSTPVPKATPPPTPESTSSWRFHWMGWGGIEFQIQEKTSFKNPAVKLFLFLINSSGVPSAMINPPLIPPSGPRSIT
jgi:hypothetical protein